MEKARSRRFFAWLSLAVFIAIIFLAPNHNASAASTDVVTTVLSGGTNLLGNAAVNAVLGPVEDALQLGVVGFVSGLLKIVGMLFDKSIEVSFAISKILSSDSVSLGWQMVRDICNMFFIFILIFISIKTILGGGNYQTKEMLGKTILAAVLINFSLFVTKAIVDLSNITTLWLYTGLTSNGGSLGTALANLFSIQNLFLPPEDPSFIAKLGALFADPAKLGFTIIFDALLKIILGLGLASVLIRACFMFLSRSITFVILAIASPIAFLGSAFEPLEKESKKWWAHMKGSALEAPVFLIMLTITAKLMAGLKGIQDMPLFNGYISDGTNFTYGMLFVYIFLLIILHKSLGISREYGSKASTAIADGLKGATKTLLGTAAVMTAGRYASTLKEGQFGNNLRDLAKSDNIFARTAGFAGLNALKNVSQNDFGTKSGRKEFQGAAKDLDMQDIPSMGLSHIGESASKGGYKSIADTIKKKADEKAEILQSSTLTDKQNVENREAFAKAEAGGILSFISMNANDRAALLKDQTTAAYKDNADFIKKAHTDALASVGIKNWENDPNKTSETQKSIENLEGLQKRISTLKKELNDPAKPGEDIVARNLGIQAKIDSIPKEIEDAQEVLIGNIVSKVYETEEKNELAKFPAANLYTYTQEAHEALKAGKLYSEIKPTIKNLVDEKTWNASATTFKTMRAAVKPTSEKLQVARNRENIRAGKEAKDTQKTIDAIAKLTSNSGNPTPVTAPPAATTPAPSTTPPPATPTTP